MAIKTAQTIDGVISHLFLLGFWPSTWLVFFFGAFLGSGALTARWMQTAARLRAVVARPGAHPSGC